MEDMEKRFTNAMFDIYRRADDEIGYRPVAFLQMLAKHGGILTAKRLINSTKLPEGYVRLHGDGRLDLSVEALVVESKEWHCLFTEDEIKKALRRLIAYGYTPKER